MKYLILFIFFFLTSTIIVAQKNDYNWISGNTVDKPTKDFSLYNLNFTDDSLKLIALSEADSTRIWMSNTYQGSFSDKSGVLKFFTNGMRVYNSEYKIMLNGDTLNPGWNWNKSNKNNHGYESSRGICILADPLMPDKYTYIIHQALDTSKTWISKLFNNPIYYTKIDLDGDNGVGSVIEKNIVIDTGHFEPLAAVKHANGRDWWIIYPDLYFNKYHRLLLTPEGIKGPWIQEIGPNFPIDGGSFILSQFSPNGNKYSRGWFTQGKTVVFDFDRCTGLLSNPTSITYSDTLKIIKNVFSPSGKYLYLSTYYYGKLFQIDLDDVNHKLNEVANSKDIDCQGHIHSFGDLANGPDGKIYLSGGELKYCITVLNEPEKPYYDCDVQLAKLAIPYFNLSFPYFPNYRLGPLIGSGCDTISTTIN